MSESHGLGLTIEYGFCPGCKTLHQMTDCPDSRPAEAEYCICCEAIRAEVALARGKKALSAPWSDVQGERAHGVGTAAQGSSAGDEGGKR